jgi:hypothetical protein
MARPGFSVGSSASPTQRVLKDYIGLHTLLDQAVLSVLDNRKTESCEELSAVMAGFMGTLVTLTCQETSQLLASGV